MSRILPTFLILVGVFAFNGDGCPQDKPARPENRLHSVRVALTIVELVPQNGADGKLGPAKKNFDEKELTGPDESVLEKLEKLANDGKIIGTRRIFITAIEDQESEVGNYESNMYVTWIKKTVSGKIAAGHSRMHTDMHTKATVRLDQDKGVSVDLYFNEQRAYPSDVGLVKNGYYVYGVRPTVDAGNPAVQDSFGKELKVYDIITHQLKTKLKIPTGQAVFVPSVQASTYVDRNGDSVLTPVPSQIMVLVSTQILKPVRKETK